MQFFEIRTRPITDLMVTKELALLAPQSSVLIEEKKTLFFHQLFPPGHNKTGQLYVMLTLPFLACSQATPDLPLLRQGVHPRRARVDRRRHQGADGQRPRGHEPDLHDRVREEVPADGAVQLYGV